VIALLIASTLSGLPPSEAVLKAYDMACNKGELHLDPSEAKVISPDNSALSYPLYEWGTPKTLTSIRLTYPKGTGIRIATYNPKYPQQMASVCVMYTRSITRADAVRAFLSGTQNAEISRDLNPARWNTPLEIDRPKDGYRKRLTFWGDGLVIMETDLYKAPH
jgi:hypothetical protein